MFIAAAFGQCARAPAQGGVAVHGVHELVAREVVALTSTKVEDRGGNRFDHVHELLQMPLNHLGMVVRIHDLSEGPPPLQAQRTRAVLTYFHGHEELPDWLWPWLQTARDHYGVRVVHFGDFGPLRGEDPDRLRRWLHPFGLALDEAGTNDPVRVATDVLETQHYGYESQPVHVRVHHGPRNTSADNRVWLRTRDRETFAAPATPIVTGRWGGIGLHPWMLHEGHTAGERRWYVDPFAYFSAALGLEGVPAPAPCVLLGRRMFFLHIDGDGFESESTVRRGEPSARVMLTDVLDRYRLPATVSVVIASLTETFSPSTPSAAMELATEIFERPFVEIASHSVLHPLDWRRPPRLRSSPRLQRSYEELEGFEPAAHREVTGSIAFINRYLAPPDKSCKVMLWSGAANPDAATIAAAEDAGCLNLNGGVFRWDPMHDSVGFVAPWGKQVGDRFQVYCGGPNENVYRGYFDTMPGAHGHAGITLANTGRGRILKPANIYVHFYAAERPARLQALHDLIQRWALEEPTIPVHASTYAAAVLDACSGCDVLRTTRGYAFRGFRACRSVRIDGVTRRIDWPASTGILGAQRIHDSLYLHLSDPDAELVWSDGPAPAPHLVESNTRILAATRDARFLALEAPSQLPRELLLGGFPPSASLRVLVDGQRRRLPADNLGRLRLQLPPSTAGHIEVRLP